LQALDAGVPADRLRRHLKETQVRHSAGEFILEKPLEDGSVAVGLFNLSDGSRKITASLADLGLNGSWKARDLWRQKEIGDVPGEFSAEVPRHGVILARLASLRKAGN
jgi:alpha-galactosidase